MKNDVNGRTFDEIFGQRGKVLGESYSLSQNMLRPEILFSVDDEGVHCIFEEDSILYGTNVYAKSVLMDDGISMDFWQITDEKCDATFYKATPDQIALLKSYQP